MEPKTKEEEFKHIKSVADIFTILFKLKIKTYITLYKYKYSTKGFNSNYKQSKYVLKKLFISHLHYDITQSYGEHFILEDENDFLYSLKYGGKYNKYISNKYIKGGQLELKFIEEKKVRESDLINNKSNYPIEKILLHLIFDILKENQDVQIFDTQILDLTKRKTITEGDSSIEFYPSYLPYYLVNSCFCISLSNKLIQKDTIYEYLVKKKYEEPENQALINKELKGKFFVKTNDKKLNNPIHIYRFPHTTFTIHELIFTNLYDPQIKFFDKESNRRFNPKICHLIKYTKDDKRNLKFKEQINKGIYFDPKNTILRQKELLKYLCSEKNFRDEDGNLCKSSKEKMNEKKIEITFENQKVVSYYLDDPILLSKNNELEKIEKVDEGSKDLMKKIDDLEVNNEIKNVVYVFKKKIIEDALEIIKNVANILKNNENIDTIIGIDDKDPIQKWIDCTEKYFENNEYFILFLIEENENDTLFYDLKSLILSKYKEKYRYDFDNKYQIINTNSFINQPLFRQKFLFQLNKTVNKISYTAKMDESIYEKKILVVGLSSRPKMGISTKISMVATTDNSFTDDYLIANKLIKFDNKTNLAEKIGSEVSNFINNAIENYHEKNREEPKNIILYMDGNIYKEGIYEENVKEKLKIICDKKNICYYFITVNCKRAPFKFFRKEKDEIYNPEPGLFVADESLKCYRNKYFEFFLLPNFVSQKDTAIPSWYQVDGNMQFHDLIPKFTYDLCYLYSNWAGAISFPHILRIAFKFLKDNDDDEEEDY